MRHVNPYLKLTIDVLCTGLAITAMVFIWTIWGLCWIQEIIDKYAKKTRAQSTKPSANTRTGSIT